MAWLESESLITTELLDGLELGRGTRVHRDPSLTLGCARAAGALATTLDQELRRLQ